MSEQNELVTAMYLHKQSPSRLKWSQLGEDAQESFRAEARAYLRRQDEYQDDDLTTPEDESNQAKYAAVDAYRASIVTTVPAHRLDTRQNGFLDGWDAAVAYMKGQGK